MWTILIALIIIGFIVNLFDKKQPKLYTFAFTDYPLMKPIRIATKGRFLYNDKDVDTVLDIEKSQKT